MSEEILAEGLRPFQVIAKLGDVESFHSGHFTQEGAGQRCALANKDAETLKIKTRYSVKPK